MLNQLLKKLFLDFLFLFSKVIKILVFLFQKNLAEPHSLLIKILPRMHIIIFLRMDIENIHHFLEGALSIIAMKTLLLYRNSVVCKIRDLFHIFIKAIFHSCLVLLQNSVMSMLN